MIAEPLFNAMQAPKPGSGKPRPLEALYIYYRAAVDEPDRDKKLLMALQLCHSLIIELSNHVYDMHGARCDP